MSRQLFVKTGIVFAILMTAAASASAEVITIVRGTFVFEEGGGPINITGNKGFTFVGSADSRAFPPYQNCATTPDCPPGTVLDLGFRVGFSDLPGTATLRGTVYPAVGDFNSPKRALFEFDGQVTLPALSDEPISITVPFDFAGRFIYAPDFETEAQEALLTGGGVVTLTFEPFGAGTNAWRFRRAEFEFRPVKR
jgi:hypothetical protein